MISDTSRELQTRIEHALRGRASGPLRWWWSPGRVEVFGKHTDYGGGPSLVGALPRGFLIAGAARPDRRVRIIDAIDQSSFELDLETGRSERTEILGWRRYVNVLARRLSRNFPGAALGADLAMTSDLPRASGMSSSSAMVVGLAYALSRIARLAEREDWRAVIRTPADLAGYFACLENGLPFGPLSGDGGVGTFGGSEDQTAIVCCRSERLSQFTYMPVTHVDDVTFPASWTFVLASSGLTAEKAGRAQTQYNRASLGVRAIVDLWRAHIGPVSSLTGALTGGSDAEKRLREVIARHAPVNERVALDARLTHFVREFRRVPEAAAAFREADEERLSSLSAASHDDADSLLGNQIPETNALALLARRHGAFAASAFGAGFGGSVWALVSTADTREVSTFADRWLSSYRAAFPERAPLSMCFAARPSFPLTELPA